MKKRPYIMSNFLCSECDLHLQIPRPKNKQRKVGHVKDMYCPVCKKETKFIEIGEYGIYLKDCESSRIHTIIETLKSSVNTIKEEKQSAC